MRKEFVKQIFEKFQYLLPDNKKNYNKIFDQKLTNEAAVTINLNSSL